MNARHPSQTFLLEAEDLLGRIEEITLELSPGQEVGEPIHQLFRAFHTIKGSGAMFGFDQVAEFTHHVETALDQVRAGAVPISEELINLILRSKDQIKALLDCSQTQTEPPLAAGAEIIRALNTLLSGSSAESAAEKHSEPEARSKVSSVPAASTQTFNIRFRPDPLLMLSGGNPITLLNELRDLGECTITANSDAVPALEELQADHCYLSWEIKLATDRGINAIKDVFIFVEDGSTIEVTPVADTHLNAQSESANPSISAPASAESAEAKASVSSGPSASLTKAGVARHAKESTVRVPSDRLDRLVNLVGELVMNQSRLTQVAARANVPNLSGPVEELERLVAELRDNVLGIRMMPIGTTFGRFKRLVHDLSHELGKEIQLITEGEDTELDKTVLDQLGDPLVHLIRNSIDHGIESPDARAATGKSRSGVLRLNAAHEGAHVIITIQDDGRGLDKAAIIAKGIEKGLVSAEAQLSEAEIFNLIFLPGFSTARTVSNVSGRGVGMDAARRTIESLRGTISIASVPGQGTTIRLTLPLTLAIIDGLLVEINSDRFIIAMSAVMENVELTRAKRSANNGRNVIAVRGELIPYVRLRDLFEIRGDEADIEKVVIVSLNEQRFGLVVDRVIGSHQTVIQPLGRFCRGIELFSGSTIMGDGQVAMILDLAAVVRYADRQAEVKSEGIAARRRTRI